LEKIREDCPAAWRQPNGIGFLTRRSVGRAKLLLSRIPAASVSSITAAPQKRWQTLTPRTSVQRLGRSLARPGLHPSFHRISEKANGVGFLSTTAKQRFRRAGDVNPPVTARYRLANVAAAAHQRVTGRLTSTSRLA
jgi:hypothetical protein